MSLLSQERGLKHWLRGSVDKSKFVAPFTGAWIETIKTAIIVIVVLSLLSQERGLKRGMSCPAS